MSKLEDELERTLRFMGVNGSSWRRHVRLCDFRDYELDFAIPEHRLYIEVQGGTWGKGRTGHSTGTGIARDADKAALAAVLGWRGFPVTADMIRDGRAYLLAWALCFDGGHLVTTYAKKAGDIYLQKTRSTAARRRLRKKAEADDTARFLAAPKGLKRRISG